MSHSRRQFLSLVPKVALAGAALSQLGGCGGGYNVDGSVTLASGKATLLFTQFPKLATAGGGAIVGLDNGSAIAVVRTSDTEATATSAVCTHEGCYVEFQSVSAGFSCPCHGATYTSAGVVTKGPARENLASYTAALTATGIVVTVS
ncbi:MAG: Rieske 2Fe-2S domain-containing protein [Deltaproteobacteria bacterium]|nr:Rieske 2Fe-2S domain-containing protein [Deltaproteobacteria bacterium]